MNESTSENQISTQEILNQKEIEAELNLLKNEENKHEVNDEEQIAQDKVKMNLVNLNCSLVRAADVLKTTDISDNDNFRLIKFQIRVRAVYIYKWVVLHKPEEVKSNFKAISEEIKKKSVELDSELEEIFNKVQDMNLEFIDQHIKNIEDYYRTIFKNNSIKNTLALKEFFSIGLGSFNQYNNGNKPFEGYALKREEPYCLKNILSKFGACIECLAYKYEKKWIIVKDDSIYYSDKSDSEKGNNVYFFTDSMKIERSKKKIFNNF